MVVLQSMPLRAAAILGVDVTASPPVALPDRSSYRRGDVSRRCCGVRRREAFPRCLRRATTPGFQAFQLLGHGPLDDRRQVPVRYFGPHEGAKPLELVAQGGAGGELHHVARRSEGLDHDRLRSGSERGEESTRASPARLGPRSGPSAAASRYSVRTEFGGRPELCLDRARALAPAARAASASGMERPAAESAPPRVPRSPASTCARRAPAGRPGSPG